ncbi:hypothetical protein [Mycobacterium szulgai]|uniref:Uncharacterized protein n=1 Tax=Mycobacterium szulgai TaxID=1787 RepID=A0A1X2FHB5_MYCSZ|nr:hypothetical protein [Mycobacterium szulgai]MCV7074594.1 hypothetical protein [Mycobacterium szulgai]ORX17708.1 hypothetical protein AWC27_17765 [Mycobacterium szulgai]
MPKIRTLSAGVLCAAGISLAGMLAGPAVASAAPGQPFAGPAAGPGAGAMHAAGAPMRPVPPADHPIYHYTDDLTHPVWSVTHPFWALVP